MELKPHYYRPFSLVSEKREMCQSCKIALVLPLHKRDMKLTVKPSEFTESFHFPQDKFRVFTCTQALATAHPLKEAK